MKITFFKYQGAGNDFVIIDNRSKKIELTATQIHHLCDRKFGIGADGLMLLQTAEGYDFEMKYYNADGNEGSMCGNGGRCLVKFAYDCDIKLSTYHFLASDGKHKAEMMEEKKWVNLKMKNVLQREMISIDLLRMKIIRKDIEKNDEIKIIFEIVDYSTPLLESKIKLGYKLLDKYPQILY